jgi:UDP-N-acetylglucosamine:LPS N-acetylglucosamine transferase
MICRILATYEGGDSNTIVIAGSGSGGADELAQNLRDDMVGYGLVKMIEQIDETKATKFAFIKFQGNDIPRMLKARLGTHMGKITEVFHVS